MRLYNLVWPIPHNLRTFAAINQFFSSSAPVGATFKQATDSKVAQIRFEFRLRHVFFVAN